MADARIPGAKEGGAKVASAAVHAACEKRDVDLALDLLPAIEPGPAAEAAFANVSCGTQLPPS